MTYATPQMAPGQQYGQQPTQQGQGPGQQGVFPMGVGGGVAGGFAGREIGRAIGGDDGATIGGILGALIGAVLPMQAQQGPQPPTPQGVPGLGMSGLGIPGLNIPGQGMPGLGIPGLGIPGPGNIPGPLPIDPEMLRKLQEMLGQLTTFSAGQHPAADYFARRGVPFDPVQPQQAQQAPEQSVSPAFFNNLVKVLPQLTQALQGMPPQSSALPFQPYQAGGQLTLMEHVSNPASFWSKVAQYGMQYGLPIVKQILLSIPDQPGQQQGMQPPMQQPMPGMPGMQQPMQQGQAPAGVG